MEMESQSYHRDCPRMIFYIELYRHPVDSVRMTRSKVAFERVQKIKECFFQQTLLLGDCPNINRWYL